MQSRLTSSATVMISSEQEAHLQESMKLWAENTSASCQLHEVGVKSLNEPTRQRVGSLDVYVYPLAELPPAAVSPQTHRSGYALNVSVEGVAAVLPQQAPNAGCGTRGTCGIPCTSHRHTRWPRGIATSLQGSDLLSRLRLEESAELPQEAEAKR